MSLMSLVPSGSRPGSLFASSAEGGDSARNSSMSVRRALELLGAVADRGAGEGMTVTELAERIGVHKSSISRLITPLLDVQLLRRDPDTKRLHLGDGALRLGQSYLDGLDLRTVAAPHLRALMELTGCTCHLVVRDGPYVVYIDKVESTATVRMASKIGARMPAYRTAVGKAMLAAGPADWMAEVLDAGRDWRRSTMIEDEPRLIADITNTRARGYAIDDRENEPEVRCVAAPVFDHQDQVVGAISVSGLVSRMPPVRVREYGRLVAKTAAELSADMGSARYA